MSYDYKTARPSLFTEDGLTLLLKIRDRAHYLIKEAGAFTAEHAYSGCTGSSWTFLAALDYLVEQGELVKLPGQQWGQYQVFTKHFSS